MAHKATTWAWEADTPTVYAKLVLLNLADHADHSFTCFPSLNRIIAQTKLSKSTVIRALRDLEAAGLIKRELRYRPDGARRSSLYLLDIVGGLVSDRHQGEVSNRHHPSVSADTCNEPSLEPKNNMVLKKRPIAPTARPMVEIREDDPRVRALRAAKVRLIPTKRFTFMVPADAIAA
jgi:DNA-binding transcriptional MocR family regulator